LQHQPGFDCYDNLVMESFFSTVKSELTDRFASFSEAKMELFDYIVVFYNQRRRHSTFGRSARPPPNDVGLPRSDHDGRSVAATPTDRRRRAGHGAPVSFLRPLQGT
jgi:transposase InsO family protein